MRCTHSGQILLWITLGMSSPAFGHGGTGRAGRAAAAQQTPTPATAPASVAGRGGRGGDASGAASEFYNYDTAALYKGDRMTAEERTKAIANLSRLTGLSKAFVVNNNLRVTLDRFNAELLRDERRG